VAGRGNSPFDDLLDGLLAYLLCFYANVLRDSLEAWLHQSVLELPLRGGLTGYEVPVLDGFRVIYGDPCH
jgi:hypothetical protein